MLITIYCHMLPCCVYVCMIELVALQDLKLEENMQSLKMLVLYFYSKVMATAASILILQ